jgi:ferredoxin
MAEDAAGLDEDEAPAELVTLVFVTNDRKTVEAPAGNNLLRVSMRQGGGIPFKCGGGICGTCRCLLEVGMENTAPVTKKERKHLTDAEIAAGWRMACQTTFTGPLEVSWVPLDQRRK